MSRKGYLIDLGLMGYGQALELQRDVHRKRVSGETEDTLMLVEHPEVITLGKSGDPKNLLVPLSELEEKGMDFYQVERGGEITYHGPGQLVGYPIFSLRDGLAGVRPFIRGLESSLIAALRGLGVEARRKPSNIGVWVGDDKIASIGVAIKRWVSFHGFALNVSTDLTSFRLINPCGLPGQRMTSVGEVLGRKVPLEKVKGEVKSAFERVFGLRFQEVELEAQVAEGEAANWGCV